MKLPHLLRTYGKPRLSDRWICTACEETRNRTRLGNDSKWIPPFAKLDVYLHVWDGNVFRINGILVEGDTCL